MWLLARVKFIDCSTVMLSYIVDLFSSFPLSTATNACLVFPVMQAFLYLNYMEVQEKDQWFRCCYFFHLEGVKLQDL